MHKHTFKVCVGSGEITAICACGARLNEKDMEEILNSKKGQNLVIEHYRNGYEKHIENH